MNKYRNQVVAGLLFISLVLIAVIAVTGAEALATRLRDFPLWLLVPVLLLKCVCWTLRYVAWRYFLGVIGVRTQRGLPVRPVPSPEAPRTIRERDSATLWLSGLSLAVSPGKLGEVLKALVLKNLTGVTFSRAAPVVFMERLVDGLAIIPLTTVAMLAAGGSLHTGGLSLSYVRAVLIGVTIALVSGVILVQIRPLAYRVLDLVQDWPGLRRFHGALRAFYESAFDLIKLRHLAPTLVLGLSAYTTDCMGFYLLLTGLGLHGTWTLFAEASFILGFSVIIASISALPGGAGGRELTIGTLLAGVAGLSKADAGTATFLISLFQMWVGVLLGLIVIAIFRETLFPPTLEEEIAAYEAAREAPETR
jgi:uncharacterized protein (TIRG00374 family)